MIIIPGISKSGTSYLTKKIHEAGHPMWTQHERHYEDVLMLDGLINIVSGGKSKERDIRNDNWFASKEFNQSEKNRVKKLLSAFRSEFPGCGFKNPRLIHFIPELFEIYPDAKYVFCIRNYQDWIQSNANNSRSSNWWVKKLTDHYSHVYDVVNKIMDEQRENVITFSYDHQNWDYLMDFLGFQIDVSDFEYKTYKNIVV